MFLRIVMAPSMNKQLVLEVEISIGRAIGDCKRACLASVRGFRHAFVLAALPFLNQRQACQPAFHAVLVTNSVMIHQPPSSSGLIHQPPSSSGLNTLFGPGAT
jgi:hypothetical protein